MVLVNQCPSRTDTSTSKTKAIPLKSAVLVIDVQNRFFVSDPKPFEADEVVERIRQHHNATLASIRSFGPRIRAVKTIDMRVQGS